MATSSPCADALFASVVMNAVSAFVAPVQLPTPSKSMQTPSPPAFFTSFTRFCASVLHAVVFWSRSLLGDALKSVAVRWILTPLSWAVCTMELPHECLPRHPPLVGLTS